MAPVATAAQVDAFALLAARGSNAIDRRELLSALAKLQARWVNQLGGRGTRTVQLTPAQEEVYLAQVRQLFDRLRQDRPSLAVVTVEQVETFARSGLLAFNPHQRRGPDGRWIKMDISELKAPRRRRGGAGTPDVPAPAAPPVPAPPVGFEPRPDKEWVLVQKRLGKRTPRLDPEGDLQPGDVVPTRDNNWTTVEGGPVRPRFWEGIVVNVRDDSKGYRHTETIVDIKKQIERYAAEKAWREANAPDEGAAYAQANANRRPGEPEIKADGRYAKPTKQYAVWNGQVSTRTSRNPYRYAAVVASRDNPDGFIHSWHRTAEGARRGTLEASQRDYFYVKDIVETGFEEPQKAVTAAVRATDYQRALFNAGFAFNPHQRRGPDGRWIKMPTIELKGPRRGKGRARVRHVEVEQRGGKPVYKIGGRERHWTPAEARAVADALDATADGQSVAAPVQGRVVSDGARRRTVEQVQPFRGANGKVILDVGRDPGRDGSGEVELTDKEARALARDLRIAAAHHETSPVVSQAPGPVDPPEYATQTPPVNLPDPQIAYREARDEYNMSVYNVAWTARQRNQDSRRPDAYLDHLMLEYDSHSTDADRDRTANSLRQHLNTYYDGDNGVLDPAPDQSTFLNVPTLPPGSRTVGGQRPPVTAPLADRRTALDRSIRSGLNGQDTLAGGAIGDTRRVRLADGTEAIYKRAKRTANNQTIEDQTDAEELASLVADAVGVRAPATVRASDSEIYMEVMPGTSAMAQGVRIAPVELVTSPEGRRMGLLDVLLNNSDRHTGNWMLDGEDMAAIDHGFSFGQGKRQWGYSAFTTEFRSGSNPLTPSDIAHVRQRLERIKPQFEALGRGDWYRQMLLRLNTLDDEAAGRVSLYPQPTVTAAQRRSFSRSGLLTYDPRDGTAR